MTCSSCAATAAHHCPQCHKRYCAEHDGHTQNGLWHWCPSCTRKNHLVQLEQFGARQIGLALALPGTPVFVGDKSIEADEVDQIDDEPPF